MCLVINNEGGEYAFLRTSLIMQHIGRKNFIVVDGKLMSILRKYPYQIQNMGDYIDVEADINQQNVDMIYSVYDKCGDPFRYVKTITMELGMHLRMFAIIRGKVGASQIPTKYADSKIKEYSLRDIPVIIRNKDIQMMNTTNAVVSNMRIPSPGMLRSICPDYIFNGEYKILWDKYLKQLIT